MSRNRIKSKGRREDGRYAGIPHRVMEAPCYKALSHPAVRVLIELIKQYNGGNNGDLTGAWGVLGKRGLRSRSTINEALKELEAHGLIRKTRQGGKNKCNLYALTWNAIDDCGGKLDVPPTRVPPGDWQRWAPNQDAMPAWEANHDRLAA